MEVVVPDFLSTVRDMVKNKTYNPSLRWKFIRPSQPDSILEEEKITGLEPEVEETVLMILDEYKDMAGSLVPILQRINSTYNYLSEPVLRFVSKRLDIPQSSVYRVATFYNAFSLVPRGENEVKVCMGTACYVKGGKTIQGLVEDKLGVKVGESTPDLKFSLGTVSCIGCCGQSPVMAVNGEIYGYVKPEMVEDILESVN